MRCEKGAQREANYLGLAPRVPGNFRVTFWDDRFIYLVVRRWDFLFGRFPHGPGTADVQFSDLCEAQFVQSAIGTSKPTVRLLAYYTVPCELTSPRVLRKEIPPK